jgi:hypothetical protein
MKISALLLLLAASGGLAVLLLLTFAVYAMFGHPGFFAKVWPMLTAIGLVTLVAGALIVFGFGAWSAGLFKVAFRRGAVALLLVLLGFGGQRWMTRHLKGKNSNSAVPPPVERVA